METINAIIINFQGENVIGKFSIVNGKLKLEETLVSWKHNEIGFKSDNYTNAAIMDRFDMIDCQRHDYSQSIMGVGSNYKIAFLSDNQIESLIREFSEENVSYKKEENDKIRAAEKVESERIDRAFQKAKETGEPVEISRYSYETGGNYVQVVNEITCAMPDGTKKTFKEETH